MGEAAMIIDDEQLQKIGEYVKGHLAEWLPNELPFRQPAKSDRELDLFERIIVIETELKNLGVRMDERFDAMEKRFEAIDKRFEALQHQMDYRFDAMQKQMDERFTAMDKRFEALQKQMDERFEAVQKQMDERFTAVDKRFSSMQWVMGIGFTVLALLMSVYQYL
jgi:chaperonin cofactor prefoldin